MNLVRSIAAVVGTLAVALAAGSLFQQAGQGSAPGQAASGGGATATASLAPGLSDPAPVSDTGSDAGIALSTEPAPMPDAPASAPAPDTAPAATAGYEEVTAPALASTPMPGAERLEDLGSDMPAQPEVASAMPETDEAPTGDMAGTAEMTDQPIAADIALEAAPDPCAILLIVNPAEGAMLDASVYAPCHGGQRATFDHAELTFDSQLSDDGQAQIMIPALRAEASVTLTLADGSGAEEEAMVPDMAAHDRLVLTWTGLDVMSLHAFADGAGFGAEGHVHPAVAGARNPAPHGWLARLGDAGPEDAALAQIYSFPAGTRANAAHVAIEVEAAITEKSCGTEVTARTALSHGGEPGMTRRVTVALPACDGIDGFLTIDGLIAPSQAAPADELAQAG